MLKRLLIVFALLAVAGAATWYWLGRPDIATLSETAVTGRVPQITDPRYQNVPTVGVAKAVGWPAGAMPKAAAGLKVQAFADKLDHPRWMYQLPNGDILVAESNSPPRDGGGITGWVMGLLMNKAGAGVPSANRITLLRDSNGDGVADMRTAFLTGLNSPYGMVLANGWLYVANTDALVRYPYRDGQTKIAANPQKILALPGGGNHWARNVVASLDGKSLYVSVGSASNIAEGGLEEEGPIYTAESPGQMATAATQPTNRAVILEVDPERKTSRIFAWGIRNANGMAFEPKTQALWAVVNERDMLGSDMPPDYLSRVDLGAFFGWPWQYWGGYVDKRVEPGRPDLREYVRRPDFALGAHTAPLGLTFADGARLGDAYANGAFVGLHGSWNRKPPSGYKVVFVPFAENGFPNRDAKPQDVLTGFLNAKGEAQGRPVGVIVGTGGALLVADDVGNRIWRVSAAR
ncbi:PQQ-dependent sugar dehydrogenase [Sphingomonas sp. HT-1]|uniref:PQQ-dependent sugar dehydrogenase n=1 Tax=unclassified Sphingomonas TaxID=196159 RepID=UPI0002E9BC24|nr:MULTISPECIES: sorbosone dehydrogenase family protein [unclassified Sphingomonas]KTF69447.1 sorbosone dehydrogenase [Sphingomonas sp. WG]